jgi:hypothetical protein
MQQQLTFKLSSECVALWAKDHERRVMMIPANGRVTLVSGNLVGDGVVKVNYHDQSLQMLASDLRNVGRLE